MMAAVLLLPVFFDGCPSSSLLLAIDGMPALALQKRRTEESQQQNREHTSIFIAGWRIGRMVAFDDKLRDCCDGTSCPRTRSRACPLCPFVLVAFILLSSVTMGSAGKVAFQTTQDSSTAIGSRCGSTGPRPSGSSTFRQQQVPPSRLPHGPVFQSTALFTASSAAPTSSSVSTLETDLSGLQPTKSGIFSSLIVPSTRNLSSTETTFEALPRSGVKRQERIITGILVSLAIIIGLSLTDIGNGSTLEYDLDHIAFKVIDASLPMTTTDVVSIAVGEAVAGIIGAAVTYTLSVASMNFQKSAREKDGMTSQQEMLLSQAVADGDFFIARAALFPIFVDAMGLPPFLASLGSVAVSLIPYELTKLVGLKRMRLTQEEQVMKDLLLLEQSQETKERQRQRLQLGVLISSMWPNLAMKSKRIEKCCTVDTLLPVESKDQSFDFVTTLSDLIKWLEFDVLQDYSGMFRWNGQNLSPGIEGAIFGSLAATSSQLYADTLSTSFGLGPDSRRKEVRSRSLQDWINVYTTKCLNAAALFGVYSAVQYPIKRAILNLITGGVDSCLGSEEFDLCMQVYESYNPPNASIEAEVRGIITAFVSLYARFVPSSPL